MSMLTQMRVGIASDHFTSYFRQFFPLIEVIDLTQEKEYDLIIFPGGADISPELYDESNTHTGYVDQLRDETEMEVATAIFNSGTLKTEAVFGACRGIQLLNAFFGGTLHQDIYVIDKGHSGEHKIVWEDDEFPLSYLKYTNSMHHQAVKNTSENGIVLAREPITSVIEFMQFNAKIPTYASQFHPEFFGTASGKKFFNTLVEDVLQLDVRS